VTRARDDKKPQCAAAISGWALGLCEFSVVVFGSGYSNQKSRSVKSQHFERYATYRWRSLTAFSVPLLPLLLPMIGKRHA
jgi:hypothetical protein